MTEIKWILDGTANRSQYWTKENYDNHVCIPNSLVEQLQSEARQEVFSMLVKKPNDDTIKRICSSQIAEARAELLDEIEEEFGDFKHYNLTAFIISMQRLRAKTLGESVKK